MKKQHWLLDVLEFIVDIIGEAWEFIIDIIFSAFD